MEYSCSERIDLPRDRVIALFDDPDALPKWQRGFVSMEHLEGTPGQDGARTRLTYRMGRGDVVMIETIERRALPEEIDLVFEADKVWNRVENRFTQPTSDSTLWSMHCEFRCSGLVRLMALVMPGMFRRQTRQTMADFKAFAERGETVPPT